MLDQFGKLHESCFNQLKVGQKVKATIQLVKEYGLIVQVKEGQSDLKNNFTGFIVNGQRQSDKTYKQGQDIKCVLLDVDNDK